MYEFKKNRNMKNLTAFLLAAFLPLCALAQVKDGDAAPDFKFKTPDGTEYTMASFNGKLVFIDVWATWCPPCRAEIPALKALEKTFEGQDVVFVSISVDKDKSAWEKFVREQSLGGVQLHAGQEGSRAFSQEYGIKTIPRFILIGRDGKIINANAPRPSQDATAGYIKSFL